MARSHPQRMSERDQSGTKVAAMRACFCLRYERGARFREDRVLVGALACEAEPVLEALYVAFTPHEGPRAVHESYALLSLLGRRAALLGATPGAAIAIVEAVCAALREVGAALDPALVSELSVVVVEGYCLGRDERITRELRETSAQSQVAIELGRGCIAIFLGGLHAECDLAPELERHARELLRADAKSCLLDVSRLVRIDEELARALGRFCAIAGQLGVTTFVVGASAWLREQFAGWPLVRDAATFVDEYDRAQALALAAAGLHLKRRRWARLIFPPVRTAAR